MEENVTSHSDLNLAKIGVPISIEIVVALMAVVENLVLIIVTCLDKKLKNRTFYFLFSLALADFITESVTIYFNIIVSTINNFLRLKK